MSKTVVKVPTLDRCCELEARDLAQLPADSLERLYERAALAQIRLSRALALGTNGAQAGAADDPLTVEEAARLCNVSAKWIRYQALHDRAWGSFTHRLSRKRVLFDRNGLEHWLSSRRP